MVKKFLLDGMTWQLSLDLSPTVGSSCASFLRSTCGMYTQFLVHYQHSQPKVLAVMKCHNTDLVRHRWDCCQWWKDFVDFSIDLLQELELHQPVYFHTSKISINPRQTRETWWNSSDESIVLQINISQVGFRSGKEWCGKGTSQRVDRRIEKSDTAPASKTVLERSCELIVCQ